ncbi:hypothetical protein PAEVO_28310 [Paenibacillus sp. GM2FR]|uniref:hypothetical protein n=1 Tax=Paenibacillus sp. GM2FR TaxID=2059268 RepID=UPI000C27CFDB|nr:hypothetical protein [Paenibacillus sp. GM2FR]PJN56108.1 hypothetical protein PAEVO_28310 [Paenibacillus sp. GM2FR]
MKTMYPAQVNSPGTELAGAIDAAQDTIQVADGSFLPDGPNLLTIGTDEAAETILYTGKTGDELTGVTRGFQGTAQSWAAGTKVARYFTAYDHDVAVSNISELSTGLTAAKDRLDIEERKDVVLNAGIQTLNAQRRAAFSLSGIKGRTIVNRMGRHGELNSINQWIAYGGTIQVASNEAILTSNGTASNPQIYNFNIGLAPSVGDKLFFRAKALSDTPLNYFRLTLYDGNNKKHVGVSDILNPDINKYYDIGCIVTITQEMIDNWSAISIRVASYYPSTVTGAISKFSQLAVYKIPSDSSANVDELLKLYPYVNSVQPVRNPYAIRYGENLLPPFNEWTLNSYASGKVKFISPYAFSVTAAGVAGQYEQLSYTLPSKAGIMYTIHKKGTVNRINVRFFDSTDTLISNVTNVTDDSDTLTFTTPENTVKLTVILNSTIEGEYTLSEPMLTLGTEAKTFKPREDSMLALQTDLFADPLTGANADEVFEKDGQYFKLAKWKKTIINGSEDVSYGSSASGYKTIRLPKVDRDFSAGFYITKYDGKHLTYSYNAVTGADQFRQGPGESFLFLTVSNTDSGWGDNYTPTADEIKAYFMGWRMRNWNDLLPYNGTGEKAWGTAASGGASNWTATLPTTMAADWTLYQLVYQLATPTVEPIVSEGVLTFNEGDNQIEVGTGIVVREGAVFAAETPTSGYSYNAVVPGAGQAKYKVRDFLNVYESSRPISGYTKTLRTTHNGAAIALPRGLFNASAAYSVTYLMLDTSPIVPFSGSYAANEKGMLQELTDAVQQNATAVSVLMNKKADKDAPGWIMPTLLNGWVNFSTVYNEAGYTKTSNGWVHFRGIIRNGAVGQNIFVLPAGFRPSKMVILGAISHNNTTYIPSAVRVYPDGSVLLDVGSFYHLSLESVDPFPAEQ